MTTPHAAGPDGGLPNAAEQQAAAPGANTDPPVPPQVPLSTKFPVSDLMGAVEAIEVHHQQQVEEHRLAAEAAAASASGAGPEGSTAGDASGSDDGGSTAGAAGSSEDGDGSGGEGKPPLGYPGTFFLEKPLTAEEAHTIPRMWQPPGGSYPGYPYGGGPGYPPPPLTGPPPGAQQPQYPGRWRYCMRVCVKGGAPEGSCTAACTGQRAEACLCLLLPNCCHPLTGLFCCCCRLPTCWGLGSAAAPLLCLPASAPCSLSCPCRQPLWRSSGALPSGASAAAPTVGPRRPGVPNKPCPCMILPGLSCGLNPVLGF